MARHGLQEVYAPQNGTKAVANIIFVHGLFGDPFETWTRRTPEDRLPSEAPSASPTGTGDSASPPKASGAVFWPHDLLPQVIPDARIYTFGYDADVYHFGAATSQNTIHQHANNLLSDVADLRESSENQLPIIFVAYSLGGVIVKDALNQSSQTEGTRLKSVAPATYGVCFLGTPHRGSKSASLGKIAYSITRAAMQRPNLAVLQALKRSSSTLNRIGEGFRQTMLKHDLKIYSFREEKETRKLLFFGSLAVDAESAQIGDGKEETDSIPQDHSNMAKFAGKFDVGFKRVSSQLRRWVEGVREPTTVDDVYEGYKDCLASLDNAESRLRVNEVATAHEKTFHWLYDGNLVRFSEWLRGSTSGPHPDPIFWIQGRPGAGKSTLMRFAMQDRRTMELLDASDHPSWLLVGFFFHDRGSLAQKSFTAMLKELLRQILHHFIQLWPVVKPIYRQTSAYQRSKIPVWDAKMLQQALLDIAQQRLMETRVCIFLDALDEHAGDNEKLATLLFRLSTRTQGSQTKLKICVASRSWTVFENHFGSCPGFAIHDHTRDDIRLYTTDKLSQASRGPTEGTGQGRNSAKAEKLAEQVTDRARGVFIWVRLVVKELAKGIRDGTPLVELEDQLSKMPQELKELYINTLRRIEPEYQDEMHIMLQIALCSFSPLPLEAFLNCTFYSKRNEELEDCGTKEEMLRRLTSRSGGLLEAVVVYDRDEPRVDNIFIHDQSQDGKVDVNQPHLVPSNAKAITAASKRTKHFGLSRTAGRIMIVQFIHQTVKEFVRDYGDDLQLQSKASSKGSGHLQLLRYGARPNGIWDKIEDDVFEHAKYIEDELPQEASMMVLTLDRFDVSYYISYTEQAPELWGRDINPANPHGMLGEKLALLRMAIAANLATYVRQTLGSYSGIPKDWKTIKFSGLLHIAVCGPKIVTGKNDRLAMLRLLLELGIPADSTIMDTAILLRPHSGRDAPSKDVSWTPLALILSRKYILEPDMRIAMAEELLKHGADPDPFVWDIKQGLEYCIRFDSVEMTRLLLRYGSMRFGTTKLPPVAIALFRRNPELRKAVLESLESFEATEDVDVHEIGLDPSLERKWGVTRTDMCVTSGILGVICTGFGSD